MVLRSLMYGIPLVLLLLATAAQAGGEQRLQAFFDGLDTMRGEFVQSLVDEEGYLLEESEGVLLLSRPGRFRLEYHTPYSQLYVADGERVWMYDQDLEQITVQEQAEALGSTPAMLLSSGEPLRANFTLEELGEQAGGLVWVELRPRDGEAGFERVRLAMEGNTLRAMEMIDGFGQITRLYFREMARNPAIPVAQFRFEPPAGVDVIGPR